MELTSTDKQFLAQLGIRIEGHILRVTDTKNACEYKLNISDIGHLQLRPKCNLLKRSVCKLGSLFTNRVRRSSHYMYSLVIDLWDTNRIKVEKSVANPIYFKKLFREFNVYFYHSS